MIFLIIIGLIVLLICIFALIVYSVGSGIGQLKTVQKSSWEEAKNFVRTKEIWDSLSEKDKQYRIACIAIILDDCGSIHTDAEIIEYLKGESNSIRINFN